MTTFYKRLSYTFGNEDWITEKKALQIAPENRVVCITASGDRPLNLLVNPCAEIVSVDANPVQSQLLNLKKAALKTLDFYSFMEFLGITNNESKKSLPRKVYEELPEDSRQFWVRHMPWIEKGIIYQGQVEKLCKRSAKFIRVCRGFRMSRLTSFDNIEEQREFIDKNWDKPIWHSIFKLLLNPKLSRFYIDDPGMSSHFISSNINPGTYIYERMTRSLKTCLARENPLFSLVLNGFVFEEAFAPHMKQEYVPQIKSQLGKLKIVTENMITYLEAQPDNSFDRFSFSDIASYMNETDFNRMLRAMIRVAKPGARFCARQFMSDHKLEDDVAARLNREPELENQLEQEDKCFLYRFMTGTIG